MEGYNQKASNEIVEDIRDKLEDLFIDETGQFAFLDDRQLNPKYIEWLEKGLWELLDKDD